MLEVVLAPETIKEDVWRLYIEYSNELATYHTKNKQKHKYNACFDEYWDEPQRMPFAIYYDHELTGFCLLSQGSVCYMIDEFYVSPLQRRRGFGKYAVKRIKEICRDCGRYDKMGANVYINNQAAIFFWRSVGFRDTGRRIRIENVRMMETEATL